LSQNNTRTNTDFETKCTTQRKMLREATRKAR